MGIVDRMRGGPEKLTPFEGFAGVALYTVIADGVVQNEEMEALRTVLRRMRLFTDPRMLSGGLDKALKIAEKKGDATLLAMAAEAIPPELKATAFAIATDLIFADRNVAEQEEESLAHIQKALGVPDDLADKIVEVMLIKNKG